MTNRQFAQQLQIQIRQYNHIAYKKHRSQLSLTNLKQSLKLSTAQFTQLLNGNNNIPVSVYHHAIGLVKQMKYKLSHHITKPVTLNHISNNHGTVSHVSSAPLSSTKIPTIKKGTHVLTSIQQQKHNPKRFNIFINYKYAFPAGLNVVADFYLHPGMLISKKLQSKIHFADTVDWLMSMISKYVTQGMHTEQEVRKRLNKYTKGKDNNAVDRVIYKLKQVHLVDDRKYARMYIQDQIELSNKGPQQLKQHLQRKGLSEFTIAFALKDYSSQAQLHNAKQFVKHLANRYQYSNNTFKKSITKIKANLSRKGYPFSVISKAIASAHLHPDYKKQKRLLKEKTIRAQQKYAKYKKVDKFKYQQKIKQYLLRQGFSFNDISD